MKNNFSVSELSLRDFISAIFRHKTIMLISFFTIIITTYFGLLLSTPMYEATVKMHIKGVSQVASDTYRDIGYFRVHLTQTEIVKSNPVIKRAVMALKLNERPLDYEKSFCHPIKKALIKYRAKKINRELDKLTPEMRKESRFMSAIESVKLKLDLELIPNTDIFLIKYRDYDPKEAVSIANVISRAYSIFDQEQQLAELELRYGTLHPTVQQLRDNINKMNQNLSGREMPDFEALGTASVKIVEQATSNFMPVGRPKIVLLMIGIFVGLFIGISLSLAFDIMNQTFKSPNDIISILNIHILGSIPKMKKKSEMLIKNIVKENIYTKFYEDLADQIYVFMKTQNLKTLLVTSTMKGEEIARIVSNLGYCLSRQMLHNTLLIDADFRYPALYKMYNIQSEIGLANLLETKLLEYNKSISPGNANQNSRLENGVLNNNSSAEAAYNTRNKDRKSAAKSIAEDMFLNEDLLFSYIHQISPNLSILPAGKTFENPVTLFNQPIMKTIIKMVQEKYDGILINSSSYTEFKDASLIAPLADGVVLVVNEGIDKRQVVMNAINPIKNKNVPIVGAILNKRTFSIPKFLYKKL